MNHTPDSHASNTPAAEPSKVFDRPHHRPWQGSPRAYGVLQIEHATTHDLPDGAPVLPGFVNDGIFWARVARLPDGRTRWRRISVHKNMVRPLGVQDETVNHSRRHRPKGSEHATR
jgi:hypothetical protein